ncbi:MAG: hypothetical protein J5760_04890, partial [Clostridia bacterium]|nr:hypothetical protein [Clostridia bacterium]
FTSIERCLPTLIKRNNKHDQECPAIAGHSFFANYDCPAGQMMILPYGKNDDAPSGRNYDMSPANVPKAIIIRKAIIMRVSAHHVPLLTPQKLRFSGTPCARGTHNLYIANAEPL